MAEMTVGTPMGGKSVTVSYTGTAGTTAALPPETRFVAVLVTTIAFVEIGISPTAVANTGMYLAAGVTYYFAAQGGVTGVKVSAIQSAAGGNLYVTPFA